MKTENVAESHQTDIPYTFPAGHETRGLGGLTHFVPISLILRWGLTQVRLLTLAGVPMACYLFYNLSNHLATPIKPVNDVYTSKPHERCFRTLACC